MTLLTLWIEYLHLAHQSPREDDPSGTAADETDFKQVAELYLQAETGFIGM